MKRLWVVALVAFVACVEKETEKVDEVFVKDNVLSAAPTPKYPANVTLGDKVVYLGSDVDKDSVVLGDKVKVTHYWKVLQTPGTEWRAFTHVLGSVNDDFINVDKTKLRDNYGPAKWKTGDILRDEQIIPISKTWKSTEATVYVGLYKKGGHGEKDRMPITTGPSDGHARVKVIALKVLREQPASAPATSAAAPEVVRPEYVIRRATAPITVDGKDDEADWKTAQSTGSFVTVEGGAPMEGETHARMLWDDKFLYVFIDIEDKDVASQYVKHDDPLWREDAVELFIDADKDGHNYVELQVNPRNATFDSWMSAPRHGDDKWDSKMITAVTVDGTLDNRDDVDKGWKAELAIPLEAVKGALPDMPVSLPPKPGDTWRLNVVRVERPKGEKSVTASAWAKITIQDFHAVDRLKLVTFGDEKGELPKAAAATQPAAPKPLAEPRPADGKPAEKKPAETKPAEVKPGAPPAAPKS